MENEELQKEFPIVSVTRADIIDIGYKEETVEKLTDTDMEELARALKNDYTNDLYWESLKILGQQAIESREIEEVTDTPIEDLPLLIGSLHTEAAKETLEGRLKS